ncbi:hypothetical protein [Methylobacter sp. BBA5.1]|uniref:hypothetical protein n=1 Tax=Methylobacter sp. BBA5.1 TaxID=1495064 RepID=UPI001376E6FF|nr:hypothetical protein [Methylobacter sp. BBA5.1]
MALQGFDLTLSRFGLENLKNGLDLQVTKSGDIAITRDGDLQLGKPCANGMFRFIERWRQSECTITELYTPMAHAATSFESLSAARDRGEGPALWQNPQAYHEVTDSIIESQLVASTLAGSIAVILNSLFHRLKLDLNASEDEWRLATPAFSGFSLGEIFAAAAANFRHYDEWAAAKSPSAQQLVSMKVLCGLLNMPIKTAKGFPTIRTNVCGSVLMLISQGSIETLHQITVSYAKSLAKYK